MCELVALDDAFDLAPGAGVPDDVDAVYALQIRRDSPARSRPSTRGGPGSAWPAAASRQARESPRLAAGIAGPTLRVSGRDGRSRADPLCRARRRRASPRPPWRCCAPERASPPPRGSARCREGTRKSRSTSSSPMNGAISARYSWAISVAAWWTTSLKRSSLRRSSGRSADRRSPMDIKSRGRRRVCRQMYSKTSSSSRVYVSLTAVRPTKASSGSAAQPIGSAPSCRSSSGGHC